MAPGVSALTKGLGGAFWPDGEGLSDRRERRVVRVPHGRSDARLDEVVGDFVADAEAVALADDGGGDAAGDGAQLGERREQGALGQRVDGDRVRQGCAATVNMASVTSRALATTQPRPTPGNT